MDTNSGGRAVIGRMLYWRTHGRRGQSSSIRRLYVSLTMSCVVGAGNAILAPCLNAQQTHVATHATGDASRATEALLARRVTIALARVTLEQAIDSLSRVSQVVLEYQMPMLEAYTTPVTLNVTNVALGEVLERVLEGTALQVVAGGADHLTIVASLNVMDSIPQVGNIVGRVVDSATGRGVNGVTVGVAGRKLSAVTQDSGRFTLRNVPVGSQILTAKVFGYRPGERSVRVSASERASVRFDLVAAPNVLSGVVTTASGVQSRVSIGNDITVLNVDSVMRTAPINNVTDLLEGRVPGLVVQRTSGTPGAPARVRLRGAGAYINPGSTTMSNDPIVVVDGIRVYARETTPRDQNLASAGNFLPPSALDQIDPNTIDKIEVFKGPSATSQWGADAANGVIVVTTKRGQGGPTTLRVALDQGIEQMPGTYSAPGYFPWGTGLSGSSPMQCIPQVPTVDLTDVCYHIDSVARFQALNAPRLSPFTTGNSQSASATVSGGNASVSYVATGTVGRRLGYLKMPALYQDIYRDTYGTDVPASLRRPDAQTQWSENVSMTVTPARDLRATVSTTMVNTDKRQSSANDNIPSLSITYIDTVTLKTLPSGGGAAPYVTRGTNHVLTSTINAQADWTRWKNIQVGGVVGSSTTERRDVVTTPYGIKYGTANGDTTGKYAIGRGTSLTRTSSANATLWPGRLITTAVGVNATTTSTDDNYGSADSLSPGVPVPTGLQHVGQNTTSITTAGWYVEPRLNVGARFFASPGLRFDGGNAASGSGIRNGRLTGGAGGLRGLFGNGLLALFPKLNFSWIAVDQSDQRPWGGFLTLLRPRVTFGVAGVQPDPWQNQRLYQPWQCGFWFMCQSGIIPSSIGNTHLHPERSREVEGGFDADLWNRRLSLTVTTYRKMRTDAILPLTLPASLGTYTYYVNAGKIRNSGEEFTVTAQLVQTGIVRIAAHAEYSANRNRVVTVNDTLLQTVLNGGDVVKPIVAGYPIDGQWARPIVGYVDTDGNGRLLRSDVVIGDSLTYLGSSAPRFSMPFGIDIALWHGAIGINTLFNYVNGMGQMNYGGSQQLVNLIANPHATLADQAAALAAMGCTLGNCPAGSTNYAFFQSVNSLDFQSLSISYVIPASLTRRVRVPHMNVAVQGSNVALWTNYRGKDPNVNANLLSEQNIDNGQLPRPRSWSLRVTLGN